MNEALPTRNERLAELAKWRGPVYQEEAYNMAEEILKLRAELEEVRRLRESDALTAKTEYGNVLGRAEAAEQSRERMREALEKFVAAKEPNGYPLWFNRAVHECQKRPDRSACDSEDLCNKHWEMAHRDFTGCEKEIAEFVKALEGERATKADLLSLGDALAEAARQVHEIIMRNYGVELPNLLAKAKAWDAARKGVNR